MIVLSLGLWEKQWSRISNTLCRWVGCAPAHCYVAGCDGELGTSWFAGKDCTVARVRQGEGAQSSAERATCSRSLCWQTEDRDPASPMISKTLHLMTIVTGERRP